MPKKSGGMAYTRHEYIHSMPQSMIKRFNLGDKKGEYSHIVFLKAALSAEIASAALEAARITANKVLEKAGRPFLLRIHIYPHEVIREHKFMGFAGADRLSRGMTKAFGRPKARAVKVIADQIVLSVRIGSDMVDRAKTALKRASKKLPIPYKISVEEEYGV